VRERFAAMARRARLPLTVVPAARLPKAAGRLHEGQATLNARGLEGTGDYDSPLDPPCKGTEKENFPHGAPRGSRAGF